MKAVFRRFFQPGIGLALLAVFLLVTVCQGRESQQETDLRFVVMGDSQPYGVGKLGQHDIFKKIVQEVAEMHPDLVIHVGDHLSGYTDNPKLVQEMWDEYFSVTALWKMPVHHVPGNHDIWSVQSEKIFQERVGKTYYSFDHKGCHFIILDSEEPGAISTVGGSQLEWLRKDIKSIEPSMPVFVFIHKPLWAEMDWQEYQVNQWNRDVHPLLRQHPLTTVFSGHDHRYAKADKDGVRYIITGGAGGPFGGTDPNVKVGERGLVGTPEEGEFHHYCSVTVHGAKVSVEIRKPGIKEGASEDCVLYYGIPAYKRSVELWNDRARAMDKRRASDFAGAAEAWEKSLASENRPFDPVTKTVFGEIERDMKSANRLEDYATFLTRQTKTYPGEPYSSWRDLTLARIKLESHADAAAFSIYKALLEQHKAEAMVMGQAYHDVAINKSQNGMSKIEAEDFVSQGGGKVSVENRRNVSGKILTQWSDTGHWVEWQTDVSHPGDYYWIGRFAEGFQNREGTCRTISIDGKEIEKNAFFWYSGGWGRSTNDWDCKLLTTADGSPRKIKLSKGVHTIRMDNPPEGANRGLNLDYILLVPAFEIGHP